jgi:AcrR family transcriptional regulator
MPKVTAEYERARRLQIVRAAVGCFSRRGYRGTSMVDIVRASGVSVGGIYSYFDSKDELFLAVAHYDAEQTLNAVAEIFNRPGHVQQKMTEAAELVFRDLAPDSSSAPLCLEFWSEAPKSERLRIERQGLYRSVREAIIGLLRDMQARGEMRADLDVPAIAQLLMAISDGLQMHRAAGLQAVDVGTLKQAYAAFVNYGLAGAPVRNPTSVAAPRRAREAASPAPARAQRGRGAGSGVSSAG